MKLSKEMKQQIKQELKKDSLLIVAKKHGVDRSVMSRYAKKHGLKLLFKRSQRPTDYGNKLVPFFEKNGLEKTMKKFDKSKKQVMQAIANWKFKNNGIL